MAFVFEISPDDSSGSEDLYDQLIEEVEEELDVENSSQQIRSRSTKEQLAILDKAMDAYSGDIDEDRWNELVTELNNIGPPERSSDKWKRIWVIRKYQRKQHTSRSEAQDSVAHSYVPATQEIIQRQDVIISGIEKIDIELKRTNSLLDKAISLLEIIAKKLVS